MFKNNRKATLVALYALSIAATLSTLPNTVHAAEAGMARGGQACYKVGRPNGAFARKEVCVDATDGMRPQMLAGDDEAASHALGRHWAVRSGAGANALVVAEPSADTENGDRVLALRSGGPRNPRRWLDAPEAPSAVAVLESRDRAAR